MFSNYSPAKSVFSTDAILQKFIRGAKKHDENVVEIVDNETKNGNQLFTNIVVNLITALTHGGSNVKVFYFDVNQHFDFLNFVSIIEEKTKGSEMEIKEWMKKFHIVRCSDMDKLIITLYSVEPLIANSKIPVKLIVLDGLSMSYWNEQCSGGLSSYLREQNYRRLTKVLETLVKKYSLSIMIRTLEMFAPDIKGNGELSVDPRNLQLYGSFWKDFVTHRFFLEKDCSKYASSTKNIVSSFVLRCFLPESYSVGYVVTDGGIVK